MQKNNKSYSPNAKYTAKRSAEIDAKLSEMVDQDMGPLSCDAIAQYCGMSKQNVYQIEKKALKRVRYKLRHILSELRD